MTTTQRPFSKDFVQALAADFEAHGRATIARLRKERPAIYIEAVAELAAESELDFSDERLVAEAVAAVRSLAVDEWADESY
jgi:hypothetical protein